MRGSSELSPVKSTPLSRGHQMEMHSITGVVAMIMIHGIPPSVNDSHTPIYPLQEIPRKAPNTMQQQTNSIACTRERPAGTETPTTCTFASRTGRTTESSSTRQRRSNRHSSSSSRSPPPSNIYRMCRLFTLSHPHTLDGNNWRN